MAGYNMGFETFDPIGVRARVDAIKGQEQAQAEQAYAFGQRRAQDQRGDTFRSGIMAAYGADGTLDPTKARDAALQSGDPAFVDQVNSALKSMDDQRKQALLDHSTTLAQVGLSLKRMPYQQRRGALLASAADLKAHGITDQEIASFDPTDQNIDAKVGMSMTVKDQIEQQMKQAQMDAQANKPLIVPQGAMAIAPNGAGSPSAPATASGAPLQGNAFFKSFVLPHEGGLNPHDANGAPTNYGINQTANPGVDVHTLTPDSAAQIFNDKYFVPSGAGNLPPALGAVHADTYFINPQRATQFLAASGGDPQKYMDLRDAWMNHLVQSDPAKYGKYAKAWGNRNQDLRAFAAQGGGDAGGAAGAPAAPAGYHVIGSNPKEEEPGLDDQTIAFAAAQYATNGQMPALGSGKSAHADRAAILKAAVQYQIKNGIAPGAANLIAADFKTSTRALGEVEKQRAQMDSYHANLAGNIHNALDLGPRALAGTGVPVFNAWVQAGHRKVAGNPPLASFDVLVQNIATESAKLSSGALGNAAPTDAQIAENRRILNAQMTWPQFKAAADQMMIDGNRRVQSVRDQETRLKGNLAGTPSSSAPAPAAPPQTSLPRVASQTDYAAVPKGGHYIGPDGHERVKR